MYKKKLRIKNIKFLFFFLFLYFENRGFSEKPILKIAGLLSSKSVEDYICIIQGVVAEAQKKSLHVQFDVFDYHNDISLAVEMSKDIVKKKYNFVIGPRTSQEVLATLDEFKKSNTLQILPIASLPISSDIENTIIRMIPNSDHYAKLSAKYVSKSINVNNILIVTNISLPYCLNYKINFAKNLKNYGWNGKISYIDYIEGNANYTKIVEEVKNMHADLVYAPNYAVDIADLYTEFSKQGVKIKILTQGAMYAVQNILAKNYNPNVELIFNGVWDLNKRGKHASEFDDIMHKYCSKKAIPARMATGFDSIFLAIDMFYLFPTKNSKELYNTMRTARYSGLLGHRKYDSNGDLLLPLHLYKLNNDKFDFIFSVSND